MNEIANTRQLPKDQLRAWAMTREQAEKFATEYQSSWLYPLRGSDKVYIYVLETEHKEKSNHER
jgi:hypothetical protein